MSQALARYLDEWLAESAKFCNRYHVRMTAENCDRNRQRTDASRCEGCGGLEDVEREPVRKQVVLSIVPDPDEVEAEEPAPDDDSYLYDLASEESGGLLEDDELDDLGSGLLALMEDDLVQPELAWRPKPEKTRRRFAVFMGRCPRCKGYMINAPETYGHFRDHDVHRCFTCGYRTSPDYVWNRQQGP